MYVFVCENSIEGIFTGVYHAWASGYGFRNIRLSLDTPATYELFCEYINVTPDPLKSRSVGRTICNRFGILVYQELCQAILAETENKKISLIKLTVSTAPYYWRLPCMTAVVYWKLRGIPM